MSRLSGVFNAAVAALVITLAPMPAAQAAPMLAGSGNVILDTVPAVTDEVRWGRGGGWRGGGRGYRRGFYRPARFYRPHRFHRPYYARPAFYGGACFIRPAGWVWTPYGQQWRPARRVCR
jgi:hypothetical protein